MLLLVNSLLLDAGTTPAAGVRYLVPFFAVLVVAEVSIYANLIRQASQGRVLACLAMTAGLGLVGLYAAQSIPLAEGSTRALGFTSIRETWAGEAAELRALAGDAPIITNNPEIVYFLLDRPAYFMPIKFDPYRQEDRADLPEQIDLALKRIEAGSVMVIFTPPKPDEVEVLQMLSVPILRSYPAMVIYGHAKPGPGD